MEKQKRDGEGLRNSSPIDIGEERIMKVNLRNPVGSGGRGGTTAESLLEVPFDAYCLKTPRIPASAKSLHSRQVATACEDRLQVRQPR